MGINFSNLGEPLSPDIRSVRPDPTIFFFPRAPELRVLLKKKLRWYIFTSHICWSYIFTSYVSWSYIFRSFADLALSPFLPPLSLPPSLPPLPPSLSLSSFSLFSLKAGRCRSDHKNATVTHEMRSVCQKLEKNCDFELYRGRFPSIV